MIAVITGTDRPWLTPLITWKCAVFFPTAAQRMTYNFRRVCPRSSMRREVIREAQMREYEICRGNVNRAWNDPIKISPDVRSVDVLIRNEGGRRAKHSSAHGLEADVGVLEVR